MQSVKGTTMKTFQILTAAAGILLVASGPSLAAKRVHRGVDAYASGAASPDRSGAYNFGPAGGARVRAPDPVQYDRAPVYSTGRNLPYADRPYGDPGRW
jgi:hypothetical protein